MPEGPGKSPFGIWVLALGYFAFYVPYSALTKALSQGTLPGMNGPVPGLVLLPTTALATMAALLLFITAALLIYGVGVSYSAAIVTQYPVK